MPTGKPPDRDDDTAAALRVLARFQSAMQRDRRAEIVEAARELVALRPPMAGQWLPLAMAAARNGEVALAREACELYLEHAGASPEAMVRKVDLLAQIGAWDEILALLREWPDDCPRPHGYAYSRGTAALYLGERDEARHWLERAIREHPAVGAPWLSLNLLVDFACEPELAAEVLALEPAMAGADPVAAGAYYYTLGKLHADRREHAQAFAAFARGAALTRPSMTYSYELDLASAREGTEGYDAGRIASLAAQQTEPTDRAIFVFGLPRSGTTLVEQILTNHSAVSDGAESFNLMLLAREIGGRSFEAAQCYVDEHGTAAAARLWQHWMSERFPAPGRIVAKSLVNRRFIGLAATLLPHAPLIWLQRDPLDCAWSCFRTRFAGEAPWSYNLEEIAFHFRVEDELRALWQDILGDRLLIVPFEGLVSEPQSWIRRILAHCGLPEEPGVFAPHENARAVTTTSAMQVRQPINRKGIGAAEPYREFLAPFIAAYEA